MIDTAEQARSVVSMAKFPPQGVRGAGSAFAYLEHGLATTSEYVAKANQSLLTMIQIESRQGLENVEEICQVDGVGKRERTSERQLNRHNQQEEEDDC